MSISKEPVREGGLDSRGNTSTAPKYRDTVEENGVEGEVYSLAYELLQFCFSNDPELELTQENNPLKLIQKSEFRDRALSLSPVYMQHNIMSQNCLSALRQAIRDFLREHPEIILRKMAKKNLSNVIPLKEDFRDYATLTNEEFSRERMVLHLVYKLLTFFEEVHHRNRKRI